MNYNPETVEAMDRWTRFKTAEEIIPQRPGTLSEYATDFCRDLLEMNFAEIEESEKINLAQKITGLHVLHLSNICSVHDLPSTNIHAFSGLVLYARNQLIGNDDLFEES